MSLIPLEGKFGSEFILSLAPLPELDGDHMVIGQVIQGLKLLAKLDTSAIIVGCGNVHRADYIERDLVSWENINHIRV